MNRPNEVLMDSKEKFKQIIFDYYRNLVVDKIPFLLLDKLCNIITEYYYEQYFRFHKQYPKSFKRYSTFQLKDLNHPQTAKTIIDFFKTESKLNYKEYSKLLLNITEVELEKIEQWWNDFARM
ncbi:MAG: hypothetical protein KA319_01205 [Ferruginibacter sp.]|nr:hypothetical protein [Ferruginibacter sp.]